MKIIKKYKEFYDNYTGPKVSYKTFLRNIYCGRKNNGTYGKGEPLDVAIKYIQRIDLSSYLQPGITKALLRQRLYRGTKLDLPYQGRGRPKKYKEIVEYYKCNIDKANVCYDTFKNRVLRGMDMDKALVKKGYKPFIK